MQAHAGAKHLRQSLCRMQILIGADGSAHYYSYYITTTPGVTVRILTANIIAVSTTGNVHSVPVLFARNAVRILTVTPYVAST